MTGFLARLAARGAGLPVPGAPAPLAVPRAARFEPEAQEVPTFESDAPAADGDVAVPPAPSPSPEAAPPRVVPARPADAMRRWSAPASEVPVAVARGRDAHGTPLRQAPDEGERREAADPSDPFTRPAARADRDTAVPASDLPEGSPRAPADGPAARDEPASAVGPLGSAPPQEPAAAAVATAPDGRPVPAAPQDAPDETGATAAPQPPRPLPPDRAALAVFEKAPETPPPDAPADGAAPPVEVAAPNLAIGRVEVVFEAPRGARAPAPPPRRAGPARTRGFADYARARRGLPR